ISMGNRVELELCDFVEYVIADPDTKGICTYIEGLKNPERFVSVARAARAANKPWLTVSAGRTTHGAQAAFSHTASVASDRIVFEAVCREEHITLMNHPFAMLALGVSLSKHPHHKVSQVAVVSPSGGEA